MDDGIWRKHYSHFPEEPISSLGELGLYESVSTALTGITVVLKRLRAAIGGVMRRSRTSKSKAKQ